jgi:hypothetical protein
MYFLLVFFTQWYFQHTFAALPFLYSEHSLVIPSAQTTFTFLPAREGAKMVRAEGITSAGDQ